MAGYLETSETLPALQTLTELRLSDPQFSSSITQPSIKTFQDEFQWNLKFQTILVASRFYVFRDFLILFTQELPSNTLDEKISQSIQFRRLNDEFCSVVMKYTKLIVDEVICHRIWHYRNYKC